MSEKTIFQLRIVKTAIGWMVEDENFDYVCDASGDNLFDSIDQAYEAMELHLHKKIDTLSRPRTVLPKTTEFSTRVVEHSSGFLVFENGEEGYVNGPDGRSHFTNWIDALKAMKRYIELQHMPVKKYHVRLFAAETIEVEDITAAHAIDKALAQIAKSDIDWDVSEWEEVTEPKNAS